MRLKNTVRVSAVAVLLLTFGAPVRADAQTRRDGDRHPLRPEREPAIALFEGRHINLAEDWGDATACLVWRQGGVLECFRSVEALDALEAKLAPRLSATTPSTGGVASLSAASAYSCSSSLRLYEYNYYGGRRLSFWDRGYWQNLYLYGFDDQASSYIVGGCYAHLAELPDGGGWWYPGPTYPYAGEPVMGWQDVISSIYIE